MKVELTYSFSTCMQGNKIPFLGDFSIKNKRDNTQNIYGIFCVVNGTAYKLKEWEVPIVLAPYGVLKVDFNEITTYFDKDGVSCSNLMNEEDKIFYANLGNKVIKLKDDTSINFFSFADKEANGYGCLYTETNYSVNKTDTIIMTERMDYNVGLLYKGKYIQAIIDRNGYISGDAPLDAIVIKQYQYKKDNSKMVYSAIKELLSLDENHSVDVIDIKEALSSRLRK